MADKSALTAIDPNDAAIAAEAATLGDLASLSPTQRTQLYGATCRSMGLNPLSRPFEYIKLNGRLTLYATRTATDQLRKLNGISIVSMEQEVDDDVLIVTVQAQDATGRADMEVGAVSITGLRGEALANARMKAITKAKRRVTLSLSGLGWLDETEVATVPSAVPVGVDHVTGEVLEADGQDGEPGRHESASGGPTDKQWGLIRHLIRALNLSEEQLNRHVEKTYGAPVDALTGRDVSNLIDRLKARQQELGQ